MKTLIEGGWVVAWNGDAPRGLRAGEPSCSRATASSTRAGRTRGPSTRASSARGKLVSPGFINTHVHTAGNGGDYLLARHGQERLPHRPTTWPSPRRSRAS